MVIVSVLEYSSVKVPLARSIAYTCTSFCDSKKYTTFIIFSNGDERYDEEVGVTFTCQVRCHFSCIVIIILVYEQSQDGTTCIIQNGHFPANNLDQMLRFNHSSFHYFVL